MISPMLSTRAIISEKYYVSDLTTSKYGSDPSRVLSATLWTNRSTRLRLLTVARLKLRQAIVYLFMRMDRPNSSAETPLKSGIWLLPLVHYTYPLSGAIALIF